MNLPHDYLERVYAGVLGKLIGVYLGRPFEGWSFERIERELGEVYYYVHERLGVPLIVTDDDITGTFTFLRALPDHGNGLDLSPAQIGRTWLNYIIRERTILWWGGLGNSAEHTAYLRLKDGIDAPRSGSRALNGRIVSEQIGSQIFIDGWAMVAPGDPELAADLARRAASVSHDGEAIYGAQVIAAMEAQAFVESDLGKLIDVAVSLIPDDSIIFRLIADIREWHAGEPDWRKTRARIAGQYGYDTYRGNCHMVPNHALIIHSLLYGDDDFQKSLMIVNTSGWDTDCNSGNVGCLLGIKNGLRAIDVAPDWRGPVADKLYLPTADGARAITDAVTETYHIANIGRALAGQEPLRPKGGARFHFEAPGSVQGFMPEASAASRGTVEVENVVGHSQGGRRSLALRYRGLAPGRTARASTPTFIPSADVANYFDQRGYSLIASPTLFPGQTIVARIALDEGSKPVDGNLFIRVFDGPDDDVTVHRGPRQRLEPGASYELVWTVEDLGGAPIAEIGVELSSERASEGTAYLDSLTWSGTPEVAFSRPATGGSMWRRAWVNGVDHFVDVGKEAFRLVHDHGRGLLSLGLTDVSDYEIESTIELQLVKAAGVAGRVQGLRRYYALLLGADGVARLVKVVDDETVLAEAAFPWEHGSDHTFRLRIAGNHIEGSIDGTVRLRAVDEDSTLGTGGIALVCEEGMMVTDVISLRPPA
jgi:ADP-ribosylglycohydrolase